MAATAGPASTSVQVNPLEQESARALLPSTHDSQHVALLPPSNETQVAASPWASAGHTSVALQARVQMRSPVPTVWQVRLIGQSAEVKQRS